MLKLFKLLVILFLVSALLVGCDKHMNKCQSYVKIQFWVDMDKYIPTVFVASDQCVITDLYAGDRSSYPSDLIFFTDNNHLLKQVKEKVLSIEEIEGFYPMTEVKYGSDVNKVYTVVEGKAFLESIVELVDNDEFTSQVNDYVLNMVHEEYHLEIKLESFTPPADL